MSAPAVSQDVDPAQILVVDIEAILKRSAAGGAIQSQAEAMRDRFQATFKTREDALLAEERALAELRQELDRETFEARAAAFEAEVRTLRRDRREIGEQVQRVFFGATSELKERLQPILVEIMSERRAGVLLDTREVLLSATALDVTEEAIRRLDAAVSRIELPELESGAQ